MASRIVRVYMYIIFHDPLAYNEIAYCVGASSLLSENDVLGVDGVT